MYKTEEELRREAEKKATAKTHQKMTLLERRSVCPQSFQFQPFHADVLVSGLSTNLATGQKHR